ncbi:MAG: class I SAM-dependent methyltransferase [Eubacteriales bacterium]|nr:class I SAM-dependent methyltransferase [Eubacteriales bacterium]
MIKLPQRLERISELLPERMERFIDVGCDHALLPLSLIERQRLNSAWAIDINSGPLAKAEQNARLRGLEADLRLIQNNGLENLDLEQDDTILIAGLGGNEILEIIANAKAVEGLKIYIQVNWHWDKLRQGLAERGWAIIEETAIEERGRVYHFIITEYRAKPYELTSLDLYLGPVMHSKVKKREVNEAERALLAELYRVQKKKAKSKRVEELRLLKEIEEVLKQLEI